jgi:DNA-binding NtrC family response regulator
MFGPDGINTACGHLGGAVSAERVQLVSVDGAVHLVAGRGGAQGTVPVDRARLEKVSRGGRAVCMRGNEREIMMSPVTGEGVLVVDRPAGHAWDRGALELVAASSQIFSAAMSALSERGRRDRAVASLGEDGELDGDSAVAARLRDWVAWAAPKNYALILGEPGVGKQRVAAAIHDKSSRASGPFVVVHCAAMSEAWLEADVFGHEDPSGDRRPGKLEAAHGGTIFFDELAALPPRCQKRLMHAISKRGIKRKDGTIVPADVRIIAGSCHDVASMVNVQAVRQDLYDLMAPATVVVPPLRERKADLVTIAEKMLYRLAADASQRRTGFAADAAARLASYDWPGNVRELRNVVERLLLQPGEDPVSAADIERAMTRRF